MFPWLEEKKVARKKVPKHIRNLVWAKYVGADKAEGKCYVCKRTIHVTDFEVGHNKAVAKGGSDNISNLRPICRSCNLGMGTMSIEVFKRKYISPKPTEKTTKKRKIKRKKKVPWYEREYKLF